MSGIQNFESDMSRAAGNIIRMQASAHALRERNTTHLAEWTYDRLVEYIKDFEAELDNEHEIGARLVSFGTTVTFHIVDVGYYDPDIITFYGTNEGGQKIQLIQNISQLSVLLMSLPKLEEKPRRLGFDLDRKNQSTDNDAQDE